MLDKLLRKFRSRHDKAVQALPEGYDYFRESFTQFLRKFEIDGPVCHVGAKDHGRSDAEVAAWRGMFAHCPHPGFVGVDIFPGFNVDVVADLCAPDLFERHPELEGAFGFVYCSALLEHVADPFAAARNIAGLLRDGGQLLFTGPWVWGYHAYPDDYWRISFPGLALLFPEVEWRRKWYSGTKAKLGIEVSDWTQERMVFALKVDRGRASLISDRGLPYLNINAVGVMRRK